MSREEKRRLFWIIIHRGVFITALLVGGVIVQSSTSLFLPFSPFYVLISVSYLINLIFLGLYFWGRHDKLQATLQVGFDLLFITALIYLTGGFAGSTHVLYAFAIISSSYILGARPAYLTAGLASVLFGLLVELLYFRIIPAVRPVQLRALSTGTILFTLLIACAVNLGIAFLMNSLLEKLRKTREQLRQARRELDVKARQAFAGVISAQIAHEIRNPLAAIAGSIQVLNKELALKDEHRQLMSIVLSESERISQTFQQFIDMANPKKEVFSIIDLSQVVQQTLIMFKASGELKENIALAGNYAAAPVLFFGNGNQFKQVFWNLAKNAIKAMPDGGTLRIDFSYSQEGTLQIRISDTGQGMTEEVKGRVFEPFSSGFSSGNGLGMSVVRNIIDDYQGKIGVVSGPAQGTEVVISLPAGRDEGPV